MKKGKTKRERKAAASSKAGKAKAVKRVKGKKTATGRAKNGTKPPEAKAGTAKPVKGKKNAEGKRVSALDAAATVLAKSKTPMRSRELITAMADQGLWTSPGGKTPWATLYSAIIREITTRGKESRFKKVERGQFAFNKAGA